MARGLDRLDPASYAPAAARLERLASPALLIHLPRVRENVRRVLALAGGDANRWRPHVKTVKTPRILSELIAAGIRNFKCATLRECRTLLETLEQERVEDADVLVAYPLAGPAPAALGRLAASHPGVRLSTLVEETSMLRELPPELGVYVDVNPGMNRSGIPVTRRERIVALAGAAGRRLRGVHFYEGHLHGTRAQRQHDAFAAYEECLSLLAALGESGIHSGELVTSGTPTFRQALDYEPFAALPGTLHRVSPGTVVLHDLRSELEVEELELEPAAVVFTRVVSRPGRDRFTCDAGSKSMAAEAGDPCAFVIGHPGWIPQTPSEEHLPVRIEDGDAPARGTPLYLVPRHVCPTVNLAEQALVLDGGEETVVSVSARAHDLEPG